MQAKRLVGLGEPGHGRALALAAILAGPGCASAPASTPPSNSSAVSATSPSGGEPAADPKATAPAAAASPEPAPTAPPVPEVRLLRFERELEVKVRSIALGEKRTAALADEPWVKERGEWKRVPIPERYRPGPEERDAARIFFGRDDRPRLMGTRRRAGSDQDRIVYLRLKPDGWQPALYEIGRLGSPTLPGGMFGVLGHTDPEVVCKVGDVCIIKRRTGWTTVDSGPVEAAVRLCGSQAWGLYPDALARMTDSGWQRLPGSVPWKQPTGFWAVGERDIWVSEAAAGKLFHYDGHGWSEHASVIDRPRELWASAAEDVWLVGDGGSAHFDGSGWSRVKGLPGPLAQIEGTSKTDLWVGGGAGLWHGSPLDAAAESGPDE